MDRPVTDAPVDTEPPAGNWLVDADDPLLTDDNLLRVADDERPDRLAWNAFRTLALWEPDTWVPGLLEMACGDGNRLSPLEWSGTQVVPWGTELPGSKLCPVVLDGPEAYVVVACAGVADPSQEELRAAAMAALEGSLAGGRDVGLVVVVPPEAPLEDIAARIRVAADVELHGGRRAYELLDGAVGDVSWAGLGRLVLDLIEEGDPDTAPTEQVHRLVTEIQQQYPGVEV
jgi:hypothetical protein